jgi:long-chain acyl-CoA synthetase
MDSCSPVRLESIIDERLAQKSGDRCFWWDGRWYSKSDFSRLAGECEAYLRAAGFTRGQRLVTLMTNSPVFTALNLAIWRIGGTIVPLNVKSGAEDIVRTLELIEPFAVVLMDAPDKETGLPPQAREVRCISLPSNAPLPVFEGPPAGTGSSILSEDTAVIFTTSGTTGLPKAVPLSHGNIYENCLALREAVIPLEPGDSLLNVMPNFHTIGYTIATILPLTMDASQIIVPGFMPPNRTIRAISEARANVMFVVPAVVSYLLHAMERKDAPEDLLDSFKIIITGGDRLSNNIHDMALRIAGKDIVEGYGLTETSPLIAINRSYETHRRGTVGPFARNYEWRLRDRNGADTDKNEGVLWVRGPSVTSGYFRSPEITAERFEDGWFNTGDYVRVEDDDYLRILDRVTDIIIVSGFNVYPQEVELALGGHPAVRASIVVGMPHSLGGEIPKAFVLKNEGAKVSERELVRYCKERLAHFKVPRSVEFVDEFPVSSTGKILRRVLRDRARGK